MFRERLPLLKQIPFVLFLDGKRQGLVNYPHRGVGGVIFQKVDCSSVIVDLVVKVFGEPFAIDCNLLTVVNDWPVLQDERPGKILELNCLCFLQERDGRKLQVA